MPTDKHLEYALQYCKKHGKYPKYIHRHISNNHHLSGGGSDWDNFWNGVGEIFKSFGKDLGQAFVAIGNFVNSHMDIFEGLLVCGLLCLLMPEMAGEFLVEEGIELTQQIVAGSASQSSGGPPPTAEDVKAATDAYMKDPRYLTGIKNPTQNFLRAVIAYCAKPQAWCRSPNPNVFYNITGGVLSPAKYGDQMVMEIRQGKGGPLLCLPIYMDLTLTDYRIRFYNPTTAEEYNGRDGENPLLPIMANYNGFYYNYAFNKGGDLKTNNPFKAGYNAFSIFKAGPVTYNDVNVYPIMDRCMAMNALPTSNDWNIQKF